MPTKLIKAWNVDKKKWEIIGEYDEETKQFKEYAERKEIDNSEEGG